MSKQRRRGAWQNRQEHDPYVRQARREGWRSRAVYKLKQIDEKERLLRPGMRCVDLGAAPGGWSQYASRRTGPESRIVAVDLLAIDGLPGVECVVGDFGDDDTLARIETSLGGDKADLVMSDMAPNISGVRSADQARSMRLAELALDSLSVLLKPGGDFVCKLFQGEGFDELVAVARPRFARVRIMKPKASRTGSREVYLVARNYQL